MLETETGQEPTPESTGKSTRKRGRIAGVVVASFAMLATLLVPSLVSNASAESGPSITEIVASSGDFDKNEQDFDILLQAVLAAGLQDALAAPGADVTVFAPKDIAFIRLARDLGYTKWDEAGALNAIVTYLTEAGGGDPIPLLTDILLYHVSPGAKSFSEVAASGSVDTLLGQSVGVADGRLIDGEPALENARLLNWQADIMASNGVVHVIDRVLLPGAGEKVPTIAEIVSASGDFDKNEQDFDILLQAVIAAGLVDTLNDADANLTVLAPKDWAFIRLARDLGYTKWDEAGSLNFIVAALTDLGGGDPIPLLTDILLYHVLPGTVTFDEITSSTSLTNLLGAPLGVHGTTFLDNDPGLVDSRLINWQADIGASNGIIQTLDRVLIPINVTGVPAAS